MILIENCRWFDCEHVFLVRIGKKKGAVILLFTIVTPVTPTDLWDVYIEDVNKIKYLN